MLREKHIAIVLAGGSGSRMNSDVNKQYMLLKDKPILYYCLRTFEDSFIDEIILVVPKGGIEYGQNGIVDKYNFKKVIKVVEGGKERYHSVWNGISEIKDFNNAYIYIHDGARPFITEDELKKLKKVVVNESACVLAVPTKDTIKLANEDGYCVDTPNRKNVWCIQTPQVFAAKLVYDAYAELIDKEEAILNDGINITDDAMVVECFASSKIKFVEGSYKNIKITTPEDMDIARVFI